MTEKPRFSLTLDEDLQREVDAYRYRAQLSTRSKAVSALLRRGLDALRDGEALPFSQEALAVAADYDALDVWARRLVRAVLASEQERMAEEAEFLAAARPPRESVVINLFDNPSAAGPALGETGQGCVPYELGPEDPPGAAYAVRVQGDSMEPDFPDGSIAFVNHDELRSGDVGIFCLDGATLIKQWHYDAALGVTYLLSLNRARADADVVLAPGSGRSLVWQGRVITRRRYPLPGI